MNNVNKIIKIRSTLDLRKVVFNSGVYTDLLFVAYISFNKHLSKILQKYCIDIIQPRCALNDQTVYTGRHFRLSRRTDNYAFINWQYLLSRRPPRLVIRATIWPPAAGGMFRPVPWSRLFLDRPTRSSFSVKSHVKYESQDIFNIVTKFYIPYPIDHSSEFQKHPLFQKTSNFLHYRSTTEYRQPDVT